MTSESTSTFTGRNEFIKSRSSAPGDCLRRRFKNAAYRNSRRIPADKPIHIANMVLDIFPSLVLWRNSTLAGAQNQYKTRLSRGTLVIPECPKTAQSHPDRKSLILILLRLLLLPLTGPPV